MSTEKHLDKSLTLVPAIALAITMVVGSGLLVLPGLAYAQVGPAAVYAWLLSAVVMGPVLIVFARLGARFPNAGGIAGFLQAAFGRPAGLAAEVLVLGALPGGAAIAITGGQYFAVLWDGSREALLVGTLLVLVLGGVVNYAGARLSGTVQLCLAIVLVLLLGMIALASLTLGPAVNNLAPVPAWPQSLPALGLVFFAFVGWELMAFTSEEFQNPRRDFPLMMVISYGIVLVLYALIAVATQFSLRQDDPRLVQAPLAAMLSGVLGPLSGKVVAGIGYGLVLANFISVVWAFSRLIFSSAREGLLPRWLAQLSGQGHVPGRAIWVVLVLFGVFVLGYFLGLVSHNLLFELASVSFFFSYLLAIGVDLKLTPAFIPKLPALLALVLTVSLFLGFGPIAAYPVILFAAGLLLSKLAPAGAHP